GVNNAWISTAKATMEDPKILADDKIALIVCDLTIEAINFQMPDKPQISFGYAQQITTSKFEYVSPAVTIDQTSGKVDIFGYLNNDFPLSRGEITLRTDIKDDNRGYIFTPENNKIVIPVNLTFKNIDVDEVFGTQSNGVYAGGGIQKRGFIGFGKGGKLDDNRRTDLVPANPNYPAPANTNKRIVKIGDYESTAISPVITYTGN